jgi:phosphatidylserine decarboxylase
VAIKKGLVIIYIPFAKEAIPFGLTLLVLFIIAAFFNPFLAVCFLILGIFVLLFFRDPERKIPINAENILSPADGQVMAITEYEDTEFFKARVQKVTIFLSILNVHINRSPIAGKVIYLNYKEGKFLPAYREEAGLVNERNTIGIENNQIKILVHQIAGILARRIVCRSKVGDQLEQGQRFGLIKFGSCTEVIVPSEVVISVQKNQKVKAGITVIGIIKAKD